MSRTLALVLVAAAMLAACGGDDENDKSSGGKSKPPTTPTATTGTGSQSAKAITSCLKGNRLNVIVNPGTVVDADYQLVINSGGAGVLYGFADEGAAKSAKGKVLKYEGSSDRDVEVMGKTVYAFYPPGHTFGQPDKSKQVRACAAG
jgi:ABC-type glycerol-3-phosphate transport system substrate-binding protein